MRRITAHRRGEELEKGDQERFLSNKKHKESAKVNEVLRSSCKKSQGSSSSPQLSIPFYSDPVSQGKAEKWGWVCGVKGGNNNRVLQPKVLGGFGGPEPSRDLWELRRTQPEQP